MSSSPDAPKSGWPWQTMLLAAAFLGIVGFGFYWSIVIRPESLCRAAIRDKVTDPDPSIGRFEKGKDRLIDELIADVRARNSLGGYAMQTAHCYFDSDGGRVIDVFWYKEPAAR